LSSKELRTKRKELRKKNKIVGYATLFAMKENILASKSYSFSLEIINLYKYLTVEKKEFVLAKQILRCGTSIGANVEEAIGGYSRKEFGSKLSIAYKEARETKYWLRLLFDSQYISKEQLDRLIPQIETILRILYSTLHTLKSE
jgi:four helix bundle protein